MSCDIYVKIEKYDLTVCGGEFHGNPSSNPLPHSNKSIGW
jgi:hypothetical protein